MLRSPQSTAGTHPRNGALGRADGPLIAPRVTNRLRVGDVRAMTHSAQLARWPEPRITDARVRVERVHLSIGSVDAVHGVGVRQSFPPHTHETLAIGVIERGADRIRYRRQEFIAAAGTVIAIPAGELHTGEALDHRGRSYRMLYPDVALMRAATIDASRAHDSVAIPNPVLHDGELARVLTAVHRALVDRACSLAMEERLLRALRLLVERHTVDPLAEPVDVRRSRAIVLLGLEYLHAHFADQVRLAELANVCGVSPFYFIRLFRRGVGVAPHAYLKQLRVNRARAMLLCGSSVAAASFACGFSDQAHLTRTFKSMLGVAPGAYRRAVHAARWIE